MVVDVLLGNGPDQGAVFVDALFHGALASSGNLREDFTI